MKIYNLILIIIITCCISGCYSSRLYNYKLSDDNKAVINRVFTSGVVSCGGTLYCWEIDKECYQNDLYTIKGYRFLPFAIKLKANEKNSNEFKVKLRVSKWLIFRKIKVEKQFLNELEEVLSNTNQGIINNKNP